MKSIKSTGLLVLVSAGVYLKLQSMQQVIPKLSLLASKALIHNAGPTLEQAIAYLDNLELGHVQDTLSPEVCQELKNNFLHKFNDIIAALFIKTYARHANAVRCVSMSADGVYMLSCCESHAPLVYNTQTGQSVTTCTFDIPAMHCAALSGNGKYIVACSYRVLEIRKRKTGKLVLRSSQLPTYIQSVAISHDGKCLVLCSYGYKLYIWTLQKSFTTFPTNMSMDAVALSADTSRIAASLEGGAIGIWNISTEKPKAHFLCGSESIKVLALSKDGSYIITDSSDNTAKLWDSNTGALLMTYVGHTARVSALAFSYDNQYIITGSLDKTVKIWDRATGIALATLMGHADAITSVAVSADMRSVVTGSYDRTAKVWNLNSYFSILISRFGNL